MDGPRSGSLARTTEVACAVEASCRASSLGETTCRVHLVTRAKANSIRRVTVDHGAVVAFQEAEAVSKIRCQDGFNTRACEPWMGESCTVPYQAEVNILVDEVWFIHVMMISALLP